VGPDDIDRGSVVAVVALEEVRFDNFEEVRFDSLLGVHFGKSGQEALGSLVMEVVEKDCYSPEVGDCRVLAVGSGTLKGGHCEGRNEAAHSDNSEAAAVFDNLEVVHIDLEAEILEVLGNVLVELAIDLDCGIHGHHRPAARLVSAQLELHHLQFVVVRSDQVDEDDGGALLVYVAVVLV
jgi:hypothetical protein